MCNARPAFLRFARLAVAGLRDYVKKTTLGAAVTLSRSRAALALHGVEGTRANASEMVGSCLPHASDSLSNSKF